MKNISEKFSDNMQKYKTVIWDWNGTLLDDMEIAVKVMNSILQERSLPELSFDKYLEVFDFPVKDYYKKLGFDFSKEPFEIVGLEFIKRYDEAVSKCSLRKNANKILSHLKQIGIVQYVLSARNQVQLQDELAKHRISEYFNKIAGLSDDYANGKESLGKKLLTQNNIEKESTLMIGDTIHDFEVAGFLGIDCILIAGGHQSINRLKRCNTEVISSLSELHQKFSFAWIS